MVPGVFGRVIPCFGPGPSAGGSASHTPPGSPPAGRSGRSPAPSAASTRPASARLGREVGAKVRPRRPRSLIGGQGQAPVGPVFPQHLHDRPHALWPFPRRSAFAPAQPPVPIFPRENPTAQASASAIRCRQSPRHRVLGHPRPGLGPGGNQHHRVLGPAHDPVAGRHIIGHDPVTALARPLGRGMGDHISVSAAKPTTSRGRCAPSTPSPECRGSRQTPAPGRGPSHPSSSSAPPALATRQSATAAAITAASAGKAACTAASICAAVSTRTTVTPGRRHLAGPVTKVTRAPDRAAPPQSPCPARPRTGWRYSAPDQSVHASDPRSPAHAAPPAARRPARLDAAATISSGSAIRPSPASPQAISPRFGPTKAPRRPASTPRLRRVAGCAHIRTGSSPAPSAPASVASSTAEARSSASPPPSSPSDRPSPGPPPPGRPTARIWPAKARRSGRTHAPSSAPTDSGVTNSHDPSR
jgi:hypothetical protein